jgi:stalled ribosome rescue protein Dom34
MPVEEKLMSLYHAVVWIDHHSALVQQVSADEVEARKIKEHGRHTRQHKSGVRSEHEFFAEVCDALAGVPEVLITGAHTAQADFRHYVEKHRPALKAQIVGWETVDHPSDAQLVALARRYFHTLDRTGLAEKP